MMNGKTGLAAASAARRWLPNQLELRPFRLPLPGLAAGKLAHI